MHARTLELLDYLDRQRHVLRVAVLAVPASLRDRSLAAERWSTAGVIEHLALVETRLAARLSERIAAVRAEGVGPELDTSPILTSLHLVHLLDRTTRMSAAAVVQPTGQPAESAWAALEQAGEAIRDALRAGDGLALGSVFMPSPRFGPMPLYYFFAFVGAHEARHAVQIREIADTFAAGQDTHHEHERPHGQLESSEDQR
jgi:hypothetical protein